MEQDLKEIIEQMNSSNTAEDEESPVCDVMTEIVVAISILFHLVSLPPPPSMSPQMVKVVKILNAHADSLNWIDRNTGTRMMMC